MGPLASASRLLCLPVARARANPAIQIPDVTSDIEDQLTGHDTYRRKIAMGRTIHRPRHAAEVVSNLVESSAQPEQLPEVRRAHASQRARLMFDALLQDDDAWVSDATACFFDAASCFFDLVPTLTSRFS